MPHNYKKRVSSAQMPTAAEVLDILKKESQRPAVRFDFIVKNQSIFDSFRELCRLANCDASWLDDYATTELETLGERIMTTLNTLTPFITAHRQYNDLYVSLYTALIPPENLSPSDGIFVFGADTNARIARAVELYKNDTAKTIIISGNSPHYVKTHESEASRMARYATEHGVPQSDLLLEEVSLTLPDNVKRSIDLFEETKWQPASLTIVSTNFVLTRALMEWYTFCPWDIEIKPVAAHPQSNRFTANGWMNDSFTVALVLNEYAKIVFESKLALLHESDILAP